ELLLFGLFGGQLKGKLLDLDLANLDNRARVPSFQSERSGAEVGHGIDDIDARLAIEEDADVAAFGDHFQCEPLVAGKVAQVARRGPGLVGRPTLAQANLAG